MTFSQTTLPSKSKEIALLVAAVAVVYCGALWGTIVSIDDAAIMRFYGSSRLSLLDVLRAGEGYYYRPLIALSYFLDARIFGHSPFLMHLENVLIHGANVVLLYLLACRLLGTAVPRLPFLAALVFAVHPVNSEAVSWIAGRTDPLAAVFVLGSALSLCRGAETGRARYTVLSVLLLLVGVMAKETAILFVPASFVLLFCWRTLHPERCDRFRQQVTVLAGLYLCLCAGAAVVLASRLGGHNSAAKLAAGVTGGAMLHGLDSLVLFLSVWGFYLKKMVFPWPLCFAITSVSPWYAVPGAAALLLLGCARKRSPWFLLFCTGAFFLLPAILVGVLDMTWTVVAERYLYLPCAFFSIAVVGYLHEVAQRLRLRPMAAPALWLLFAAAALSTVQRTTVWHSNLSLFTDTVSKTPDFGMLHNELAAALATSGRLAEAEKELEVASTLRPSELVQGLIRRNRILIRVKMAKTPQERRTLLLGYGWDRVRTDPDLLRILRDEDYAMLRHASGGERDSLASELIEVGDRLYAETGDTLFLYNNGQLHLGRGDEARALSCFARCAAAPEEAFYKEAAAKLAARLGGKQ
ncbi:glycosyltransferase family 39 protein [Geomonas sp. RF6]|uniref:glycosyltransferase family 39 protein n=1 Tax=Geomonas sp. RF6 TaxID=2897342 RepID=UPI001E59FCBD|nr:glycosyltransferase family 39 protein [Geomonas sp. RF6]UFS69715.1 glycosyltransferase family 39 protein [Geomonas sp. RF6]